MNGMRRSVRIVLIAFILMATATATWGSMPVKTSGSEGLALLRSMTNSSPEPAPADNDSGDLWSWGSRPRPLPESLQERDYLNDPAIIPPDF